MRTFGKSNYSEQLIKQSKNGSRARAPLPERAHLSRFRVIQRDLVYVIGIPIDIANEDILSKYAYFGQYGQIKKIVVNNQTVHTSSFQKPTVSAYVTFQNIEDAWECLYALESFSINGHSLKASFGTSKYCSAFLSGQKCLKPDCMYLHYTGDPKDSFCTDEIQQNSDRFLSMTRPLRPPDYYNYEFQDQKPIVFPPRRILRKLKSATKLPTDQKATEQPGGEIPANEANEENEFLNSLFGKIEIVARPLKVEYSVGQSLNDQLNLCRPSIRSVMFNDKRIK
ncbi:hypothetical protein TRFO_31279 [Tritrichomonas foetus]|uniref:RRM domain-containing protein n=1 Tax=Tritrichomonas foetus TaxID=1144522 RepID=A0A1J4JWW3_9EUKA|nr:hypothetical protein TRFO_31279 [Tritrichomonas foetus]|eukprot:OHT01765.1 hypothetical protein TRFO_31279 [Tritrichomonas foetus]